LNKQVTISDLSKPKLKLLSGAYLMPVANLTIVSYNANAVKIYIANAVKIYIATSNLVRLGNKNVFLYFEKRSSLIHLHNAGVVVEKS
jgi:hypothetical protein